LAQTAKVCSNPNVKEVEDINLLLPAQIPNTIFNVVAPPVPILPKKGIQVFLLVHCSALSVCHPLLWLGVMVKSNLKIQCPIVVHWKSNISDKLLESRLRET
jgi:hypothetical protein